MSDAAILRLALRSITLSWRRPAMFRFMQHLILAPAVFGLLSVATPVFAEEIRVVEVPIYEGATEVSYMKRRGDVRYQVTSDFKTVGNFYAKKLTEQQWSKSGKDNLQRNFWVQKFSKGNASLEVRVDSRKEGRSEVRLTPQGMMWEEDDQPTPKDLPLPDDATNLKYNDFLGWIDYKSGSDVKTVAEFLSTELKKRKWTQVATEYDLENSVRMNFAYDKSTLQIDVRSADPGSVISIRTEGMQWDGMKAAIEQAKKEAERIAAEESATEKAAEMAAALQKRKNRPKQGISKLPKLPSEATVVMDGKTYKLAQVIAYEVFQCDEWSTKIVATTKPVKQATLLERLKKNGTDSDEEGSPPSWPQPYLEVVLDEDDRPWRMSFLAGGTPGNGSGDELTGTALVEDGRARGTVALKEPGSFFDKVYTADISFDVPVLTRVSTPEKRLAEAPKLANSGRLVIGSKTYKLTHVVAYEMNLFDEPVTSIMMTERPINMRNLTAALGKPAADDFFEFTPQVKLLVDADDNVSSVSIWADNMSLGSNNGLSDDIVVEDGRARGVARMTEPGKFFDTEYSFDVSFDVNVLGKRTSSRKRTPGGLSADSYKGLPVPQGYEGMESEGSRFQTRSHTTVAADLAAVVNFYRDELASGDWGQWQEQTGDAKVEKQTAELVFTGPAGGLTVQLKANGKQTAITMVSRDAEAAKAAGMLPSPGKSRLFIANESARESVITISKRDYKIAAGAGARDPKTGFNWEVAPGNYSIEIKTRGGRLQSEKLTVRAGQTMGVIINASGGFSIIELY